MLSQSSIPAAIFKYIPSSQDRSLFKIPDIKTLDHFRPQVPKYSIFDHKPRAPVVKKKDLSRARIDNSLGELTKKFIYLI